MTGARIRLLLAALLFFGWLGWLGTAVWHKGTVQIVSKAQLTGAAHWVVAEVTLNPDGTPNPTVTVKRTLPWPVGAPSSPLPSTIEVRNLPAAATPLPVAGGSRTPPPGEYLLALVPAGENLFKIAGLPRSPGYEAQTFDRPVIYPWTDDVKKQVEGLLK